MKSLHILTTSCLAWALALLCTGFARAEKPSDHAWQAQWIGPALLSPVAIQDASWIWMEEAGVDPVKNAPAGARFFRREIEVSGDAPVKQAVAAFAADNHFKVTINGRMIGGGDDWQVPVALDVTSALKPGRNEMIIQVDNDPASGPVNAAGLIGKIRIERGDGTVQEIVTDSSWHGSSSATSPQWKPARVLGAVGTAPWSAIQTSPGGGPKNLWTCYRKGFTLNEVPKTAPARIAVDSKYWLWVNGRMAVREGGLKRGPNPQDTYFDVVDLAPYLKTGDNTIAVLAWYWGKDGFSHKSSGKPGFLFEMEAGNARVLSDPSWRTLRHPAFGEAGNTPNFRLAESSVRFDARQDPPGWMEPGFDDRAWASAGGFGSPPVAPWNRLWQREVPQWKDFGLKDYVNAADLPSQGGGTAITARLPYNAQITPWLKVSAPAGLMIRMGTDNTANEILAEYITREGEQEFETPAWMSGHSVVYQIPAGVRIAARPSAHLVNMSL